jgi:VCBS repeat-containing protein
MTKYSHRFVRSLDKVSWLRKRTALRALLMEGLEPRALMAVDAAAPVFAPGTADDYVRQWIDRLASGSGIGGGGSGGAVGSGAARALAAPINLSGDRWTNPTGGPSPNEGDPATITWSIVPDGTAFGGPVGVTGASNLVAFMDGIYGTAAGPISARPWFPLFTEAYDRWAQITGLKFIYESNDDGSPIDIGNNGVLGVRADMRIGGQNIDGDGNVLAFAYYPNQGGLGGLDGDMVIDTNDNYYRNNAGGDNRGLINVLTHELGHGIGLGHVIPSNGTKLMEPIISRAFIGPQHDDILGAQTLYGDNNEDNDAAPTNLGIIANGRSTLPLLSIDRNGDRDEYRFSTLSSGRLTVRVTPVGEQYLVGPQGGSASPVDTVVNKDLSFELLDASGNVLVRVNSTGVGFAEELRRFDLNAPGDYRLRVSGAPGETQLYSIDLIASGFINSAPGVQAPRLLSIAPNSGETFNPNAGNASTSNVLNESPRELVFRFSGSQQIDPTTLSGIRMVRSGGDGDFGNGNEVVVVPTFLGLGDNDRTVVARFGEALPDDRYRIEILGVPDYGLPALQSLDEQLFLPRFAGTTRDTYYFNLELGAKILAIVPQPVRRLADGSLQQDRDKIEIYFNDDDLSKSVAETTNFYKLILTRDSVRSSDDVVFEPTSVVYDASLDKAVLTFATALDQLTSPQGSVNGVGTFRLRIGSNRPVSLATTNLNVEIAQDVGDTLALASTVLGTLDSQKSFLISANAVVSGNNQLSTALTYPGSNFDPGHRDIQDESHLGGAGDLSPQITKITYSFSEGQAYGTGSNGQPLFSIITPDQKARVREIFEFYSVQAGLDFAEVADASAADFRIVVGDMYPLSNPPPPFTPAGIAGGGLAIMNGALSWNNGLGESFFDVALHEIGHLLGLGHSYELPSGTVMGSTGQLNSGNPIEFFFPGNHDIAHLQHLYRPDNRDVDIYRFNVPNGQTGTVVAETIAERLANSSDLDTYLTLFRRDASGLHIIAINDNYFSDDSLVRAEVTGAVGVDYFIAVTSRGNESYDPKVNGSGSGGLSQGRYQLRFDYQPKDTNQIVDTDGLALDGDGNGLPGGEFNFWFRAVSPVGVAATGAPKTIFVDKDNTAANPNGSLANPHRSVQTAMAAALPGDVVRIVGSAGLDRNLATVNDNIPYEFGDGGPGKGALADGARLAVPKGVTLMVDAGAILKFGGSQLVVGSSDASKDSSGAALQVLGIPGREVYFTSHFDESLGLDTNLLNTTPQKGDWGGIEIRNDVDRSQGRREPERDGIFLSHLGYAAISYGGGSIVDGTQSRVVNPIHLNAARPTLLNNRIEKSADAGISADPNSFEETRFTESRYQLGGFFTPDYERIGPTIIGQRITDSSTNGLFIRIDTLPGQQLQSLNVPARLDDDGIVYVLGENLVIQGTPGGAMVETVRPNMTLVTLNSASGGTLAVGTAFSYRLTYVDSFGNESLPSLATGTITPAGNNRSVLLNNLPTASGDFVGRRLYRNSLAGGTWDLVVELDKSSTSFTDTGSARATGISLTTATTIQRARPDASLIVDPGVVIKSQGARIEIGIGAQLIAEGTSSKPVVFTSRKDDRYGAGVTFDTNNDGVASTPAAGDWSGILARHASSLNIDSALITFGGGASSISGGFATFNAIEVHQASARIAHSVLENNAQGNTNQGRSNRDFRGLNDDSVIFVAASQPVIVDNIIRNNQASAAISIDADSMKAISVRDYGRSTGENNRSQVSSGNLGPLVAGNRLGGNEINGMRIRGATLTTEGVWDDTDIVHVLESQIVIPDFHTFGGLRLQSRGDESLVVKLRGDDAGFTASGRPLDIPSRIGGSLQIIGSPGFPVVLTSLSDDSVGAGFDWTGLPMVDTNNDRASLGVVGDWRSVRLDAYSNDRNVDTTIELESDAVGDKNRNDLPSLSQSVGTLADNLNGGDENVRLGFTVFGTIGANRDLDVYQFRAKAGTMVWLDIDRTGAALDAVLELIDADGNILTQSDHSFTEASSGTVYTAAGAGIRAFPMSQSPFVVSTSDFQTTNPLDPGLRLRLPGTAGTDNTYYVRVRSSNLGPTDPAGNLQSTALVSNGLTSGPYRLQVRLQQQDEVGGSTVRYADIRYAVTGLEVLGMPGHSPLVRETSEDPTNPTFDVAQDVGNIANSDRAAVSIAGNLNNATDVDWYRFRVYRDSIQTPGGLSLGTVLDLDYSDGLGRPDATLWVYRLDNSGSNPQLVMIGTDSNVADDRGIPASSDTTSDLSRGSLGPRDPFIGAQELPDGEYLVAVSASSRVDQQLRQYSLANAVNPLFRLEPLSGYQRISEDTFDANKNFPTFPPFGPLPVVTRQVTFEGVANAVPFNLADVTLFVSQTDETVGAGNRSRILYSNAMTGAREAELGTGLNYNISSDIAVSPSGVVVSADIPTGVNVINDATVGFLTRFLHDGSGQTRINAGIQTYEAYANGATFQVTQARTGGGTATNGVGTIFTALSYVDDPQAPAATSLALFAIGQRASGQPFDRAILGGNPIAITGIEPGDPVATPYRNILYRLNPDTLEAISPPQAPDRSGNYTGRGTGTDVREYGVFAEVGQYTWDRNNNAFGDNIVVTRQANGDIVGLAPVGNTLYGITDQGELWAMPMGSFNAGFQRGATLVSSSLPRGLTGLTRGPRNVEGGIYADLLFAIDDVGEIYAFDITGTPQPIFPGATTSILAPPADGLGTVNGIDFAALDVNLWHVSNRRGNDPGHGRPATFDEYRSGNQAGGNSLYFGFAPNTTQVGDGDGENIGNWTRIYQNAATAGTYNLAGGAQGAIESNPIDLGEYAVEDKPMLYFNYRSDTQGANGPNTDNAPMLDSFRVYAIGEDGVSRLLATNNNADDNNYNNTNNEFDPDNNLNSDAYGTSHKPQVLFDVSETTDANGWRQARIPLAAMAGQRNFRIRIEFSSNGSFDTGDELRGGVELGMVAGARIDDGDVFTVSGASATNVADSADFELDLGLVLNLPSGASIQAGNQLTVQGRAFTFVTTPGGGPREILFTVQDNPNSIASKVRSALVADGFSVFVNSERPNILNVQSGTRPVTPAGTHSVTGLDNALIIGRPGAAVGNIPIVVHQAMSAAEVRDAVRTALAGYFNALGQQTNVSVWKFYNNTLQLYGYTVDEPGPFIFYEERLGDTFGPADSGGPPNRFVQASGRASDNDQEGIYIDDIMIAFAERGEMAVGATAGDPIFQTDGLIVDGGYPSASSIPSGTYQLEIRTAADYLIDTDLGRTFDSNDRLSQQLSLVISDGGSFYDGATFTLSDGLNTATFEFDVTTSNADRALGVLQGNIPVRIRPQMTAQQIATVVRDAINGPAAQSLLTLKAGLAGQMPDGLGGFLTADTSTLIQLHGSAASDVRGNTDSGLAGISFVFGGLDSAFGEDLGDGNRRRDQGQILIASNTVRDSQTYGIVVDAGNRTQTNLAQYVGDRPYPGGAGNLVTFNTQNLAPGVVVANNIVAVNTSGGILVSGDNATGTARSASNIARVYNNTVYGIRNNDTGITVEETATATLLNNIIVNHSTGIRLTGSGANSVLGANLFQLNDLNTIGGGIGTFPIALGPLDPLFVDVNNYRFFLASQSQAIDSSLSSLAELSLLSQVKNGVGLPPSPLIAPPRDVVGVARVDDLTVNTPAGQGQNVNIDRGAVERADSQRLKAVLSNPLDNDALGVDADINDTYVRLLDGSLEYFSILLSDGFGTGPDATTVLANSVILTENGRTLVPNVDYIFGFNAGSNTIRLTPLSGLWRIDSVYEISLVNTPTYRIDTLDGASILDGEQIVVTLSDNSNRTLEFDSGFIVEVPVTLTGATANGQTFTYTKAVNPSQPQTFEFNVVGDSVIGAGNTIIDLLPSDDYLVIASKVQLALAGLVTGGAFPVSDVGRGRVHVGGVSGDTLVASNNTLSIVGNPGVAGSLRLQAPASGGSGLVDGETFSITNSAGVMVKFEFDSNAATTLGNRPIVYSPSDTADDLASKIAAAISTGGLGLSPTTVLGGVVVLNEPQATVLDLSGSSLTRTGVAGGAIAVPFVPSDSFSAVQVAAQLLPLLGAIGQGVQINFLGDNTLALRGISGLSGVMTSAATVIRDIAGNPMDANRPNALTQFTIVMPGVELDFGDARFQALLVNNGARHAQLPPDARSIFLGPSVDTEPNGFTGQLATGDDLDDIDDEDGVTILSLFNTQEPTASIRVNASGFGFVDAWIDWNRDLDFSDVGEQILTNRQVAAGDTNFSFTMPSTASVGVSYLRVRLSTLGNLSAVGVGVGGEVEDYRITIVRNSRPVANPDSYTLDEDTSLSIVVPGVLANDSDADVGSMLTVVDSDSLTPGVQPLQGPQFGTLVLNSNGSFSYVPQANFAGIDSFSYHVFDGVLTSVLPATVTLQVNPINDAPIFSVPAMVDVLEDQGSSVDSNGNQVQVPVTISAFATGVQAGPSGATDENSQGLSFNVSVKHPGFFEVLPTLAKSQANPTQWDLTFTLAKQANRDFPNGLDNLVVVTLVDSGSGVPPNSNTSAPQTFSINIQPVNDAPIADSFAATVEEDSTTAYSVAQILVGDVAGPPAAIDEASQTVSLAAVATISTQGGNVVAQFSGTTITGITYTPRPNFVGTDTITYTIIDNGNPAATGTGTLTIQVTPINDAPTFSVPSVIQVVEDQGSFVDSNGQQVQVPISLPGIISGVNAGPANATDEAGQSLTFEVVALEPSFFEVQPTIVRSLTQPDQATLSFTLAKHRNRDWPQGTNNRLTIVLRDDGLGTAPHANTSALATVSIDITPVNDPPFTGPFAPTVAEDSATIFTAAEVLQFAKPAVVEAIDEATQSLVLSQVDLRSARGGVINPFFSGQAITSLRYIPSSNFVGTDTFTYRMTDSGNPALTAVGTVTVTVTAVNDPPVFTAGADVAVDEDSSPYASTWATSIQAGPSNAVDELTGPLAQTVSFEVSSSNTALFASLPAIDSQGVLRFSPARNANGVAVVSVVAVDSGSGVSPNVNRSPAVSFTVNIRAVNDAPIFTPGGNVTVLEDAGMVSQGWASGILPAAGLSLVPAEATDEASQSVSMIIISNSNPGLFAVAPTLAANGNLSFTTAENQHGSAVVIAIARDSGATGLPNVHESAPATFTITLSPVNDAPIGGTDRYATSEDTELVVGPSQAVTLNDSDPDGDSFSVVPGNVTSLHGAAVVLQADGTFRYDPRNAAVLQALLAGQTLDDTFSYRLVDSLGAQSQPVMVTVTVSGVNDPPRAVDDMLPASPNATTSLNVLANDIDPDTPINPATVEIGIVPSQGVASVAANGRINYTPNPGFRGTDSFTYRVRDTLGALSNEATVTVRINSAPVALADTASVLQGGTVIIPVLNNDTDPDGNSTINPSSVTIVVSPTVGTATVQSNGTIRFTAPPAFGGNVSFSYKIADSLGAESAPATVTVGVVTSLYQNPANRYDVNNDGFVSPIDALIVINDINRSGVRDLGPTDFTPPPYIDVNGSSSVEPIDILQVINYINRQNGGTGEGEAVAMVVPSLSAPLAAIATTQREVGMVTAEQVLETVRQRVVRQVGERLIELAAEAWEPSSAFPLELGKRARSAEASEAALELAFGHELDWWE